MSLLSQILLGVSCSVGSVVLVWLVWWMRIFCAAGRYCGRWEAFDLDNYALVPMPGATLTTIRRAMTWRRPSSWIHPEMLTRSAGHASAAGNVRLEGDIGINPITFDRAVRTLHRVGELKEYAVQDCYLMRNGDIYVVPVVSSDTPQV